LWIEYSSFFKEPTGSKDYEYICKKFDWIFISKFQKGDDDSIDIVRRFISFIDISYASRAKIKFFFNELDINEIYSGSKIDLLWSRCTSRLSEMRTYKYLNNS
jgi:predicted ATPase